MDEGQKFSRKIIISVTVTVALAVLLGWLIFNRSQYVTIEIYAIPSDTQITMDGKAMEAETVRVKEGKHTITGQRQHFETVVMEYDTDQLTSDKLVIVALYPNSPEGQAYLDAHPEEAVRYERISGIEFTQLQEKLIRQYPSLSELPYRTVDYTISYYVTEEKTVAYTVQLYPAATVPGSDLYKQRLVRLKTAALNWLKTKGVDPSNSRIEFSPDPDAL